MGWYNGNWKKRTAINIEGNSSWLDDSSASAHTVTASGATQSAVQSKFGGYSANFVRTNTQYLSVPDSADFYFSTDPFTIDMWLWFSTLPADGADWRFCSQVTPGTVIPAWALGVIRSGATYTWRFRPVSAGGTLLVTLEGASTPSVETWYHLEVGRNGSNWYMFLNGTSIATASDADEVPNVSGDLVIGHQLSGSFAFDGYIDEFRISKGICRHTANFTPETVPYATDANTVLLLHFDGGEKANYTSMLDAYYGNHCAVEANGIFEWFMRTGFSYEGTYDRTYFTFYSSTGSGNGEVYVRYWDEDDLSLSDRSPALWSTWGYDSGGAGPGDDHACGSIIVLRYQGTTYGNAANNGKILVSAAEHGSSIAGKGRVSTRRSTSAEDISAWDAAVTPDTNHCTYAMLAEMSDGKVFLFVRKSNTAANSHATTFAYTSTDGGASWSTYNGGSCLWENATDDAFYVMVVPDNDDNRIHVMLNPVDYDSPAGADRHRNIYYLQYKNSDGKWYKVDGTTEFTLGGTTAGMTLVYTTDSTAEAEDWTYLWDIMDDGTGQACLLYCNDVDRSDAASTARLDIALDVLIAIEKDDHSGFDCYDTGININRFGTLGYPAGAVFGWHDKATIYACVNGPTSTDTTQLQRWTGATTSWTKQEDITQAAPGWAFRPIVPFNAKSGGYFQVLFCYTERYTHFEPGLWESMLHAYPGFNNQHYIKFSQDCRTDFGDLRIADSDGSTLLGHNGEPWIQEKTDSWRALLWLPKYTCPDSSSADETLYCYYENAAATNANDQDTMDGCFLQCDGFDGSSLLPRWMTPAGVVTVTGGNLVLEGGVRTRIGDATYDTANSAANYFILARRQAVSTGYVTEIAVKTGTAGNIKVALYADNAGEPGTLRSKNESSTACAVGTNYIKLDTPYSITSGEYYWLAFCSSADGVVRYGASTGTTRIKQETYSTFTFPSTPSGLTNSTLLRAISGVQTRALIQYTPTNAGPVEVRGDIDMNSNQDGGTYLLGACEDGGYLTDRFLLIPSGTADRMALYCTDASSSGTTAIDSMDTANWHTWALQWWARTSVTALRDQLGATNRLLAQQGAQTSDPYIPEGPFALLFRESSLDGKIGYVAWVFMRPLTTEPTITVSALLGEQAASGRNAIFFGCNF